MKNAITIIFITLTISAYSQKFTDDQGLFHYNNVVEIPKEKQEIKALLDKWIAINFKNSNYVTKLNTEDAILVKGSFKILKANVPTTFEFTMDLAIKDGKYKLEIYDLSEFISYMAYSIDVMNPENFTYEIFKAKCVSLADGVSFGKNMMLKKTENQKFMDKHYDQSKTEMTEVYNSVKAQVESIAESIKSYVENNKVGDW